MTDFSEFTASLEAIKKKDERLARLLQNEQVNTTIQFHNTHFHIPHRKNVYRIEYDLERVCSDFRAATSTSKDVPLIVVGLYDGIPIDTLLRDRRFDTPLIVLEKNAGLIRSVLERFSWASFIENGQLSIHLPFPWLINTDISETPFVCSEFYSTIYADVHKLLLEPPTTKSHIDVILDGELMVDDIWVALTERKLSTYLYPAKWYPKQHIVTDFLHPKVSRIWSVNRYSGMPRIADVIQKPYVIYEIDPDLSAVENIKDYASFTRMFTYRKSRVELYKKQGWQTSWLPLATSLSRNYRSPSPYKYDTGFIGTSLFKEAQSIKTKLLALITPEQQTLLHQFWEEQQAQPMHDFSQAYSDALLALSEISLPHGVELIALLREWSASVHRSYLVGSGKYPIRVWGDEGWLEWAKYYPNIIYMGKAGYFIEVPNLYNQTKINLDITRLYQLDIATTRIFDAIAARGLVVSNSTEDLKSLFPSPTIPTFTGPEGKDVWIDTILSFSERQHRELVEQFHQHLKNNHTLHHRIQKMVSVLNADD